MENKTKLSKRFPYLPTRSEWRCLGQLKFRMSSGLADKGQMVKGIQDSVNRLIWGKSLQNLLFSGILKSPNENLVEMVTTLSSKLQVSFSSDDISSIYWFDLFSSCPIQLAWGLAQILVGGVSTSLDWAITAVICPYLYPVSYQMVVMCHVFDFWWRQNILLLWVSSLH